MQSFDYGDPYKPYTKPETAGIQSFGAVYPDAPKDEGIVAPISSAGKFLTRCVPFAKFAFIKEDNEAFMRMNDSQKITALTMETVMAGLFITAPFMFTAGRSAVGGTARAVGKAMLKPVPNFVEDMATYTARSYPEAVSAELTSLKFSSIENVAIRNSMRGGGGASLKKAVLQQAKTGASPAWKKYTTMSGDFAARDGGMGLTKELRYSLTPTAMRRKATEKGLTDTLNMKTVLGGTELTKDIETAIVQKQLTRYYGKDLAATKTVKNMTEKEIAAVTADILRSPAMAQRTINPQGWVNFKPIHVVFGAGDALFGTHRNILRPVEAAMGNTNKEGLKYILLLQGMLEQRGLGSISITEKAGKTILKFKPNKTMLNVGTRENANAMLETIDGMLGKLHKINPKDPMLKEITSSTIAKVDALKAGMDDGSAALQNTMYDFFDKMYGDRMKWQLRNIIDRTPLTPQGVVTAERMLNTMDNDIAQVFGTASKNNYVNKVTEINGMLGRLKKDISPHIFAEKDAMRGVQKKFQQELTMGGEGTWLSYLDHYTPRLYEGAIKSTDEVMSYLKGDLKPFFSKPREMGEGVLPQVDLETKIAATVRAHVKERHLYPTLKEVARTAENLPEQWRELTGHWFARLLNIPSDMDNRIASVMTGSIGKIERVLGKSGVWDGYRVSRLASTINDGVYSGILGANPWSAGRNSLQAFLNVPADFGGVSNYPKLLRQYARLGDEKVWAKLNKIGVFTDYAPELTQKSAMLGLGKKIGNFAVPRSDKFRDWSMWGFHGVDRMSRFVTGSMALDDFALAAAKVPQIAEGKGVSTFMRHAGVKHTQPWIQKEVEYYLRNRQFSMAEEVFAKAKVGDTQYLYGSLYSPIISQTWGAFGKTGVVFNSWWMNYGQLVKKWMTTGDVDMATSKLFAWMTSSAMMYTAIEPIWGDAKAINSTLFGPFPGFQTAKNVAEGRTSRIPDANLDLISGVSPVWRVPVEAMRTFAQAGAMLLGGGDDKAAIAQMNSFRKSFMNITVPAWNVTEKVLSQVDKGPAAMGKAFIGIPKFR